MAYRRDFPSTASIYSTERGTAKTRGGFILSVDKGQGEITHGVAAANDHDRLILEEEIVAGCAAAREGAGPCLKLSKIPPYLAVLAASTHHSLGHKTNFRDLPLTPSRLDML